MNLKKYEGHKRGPWKIQEVDRDILGIVAEEMLHTRIIAREINPKRPADNALMADAPLLLEEVKRLRKRNEWLEEVVALAQEHGGIDLSDYGWPQWREEELHKED